MAPDFVMRIATWNVNSLKARLEKVTWWLERARPDVLLMQETKLTDANAPVAAFRDAGYELVHHGEGRWNGVAIASRRGIADVVTNFGEPLRPSETQEVGRRRAVGRSADDRGDLRRRPGGVALCAERSRARHPVLRGQAGLVRTTRPLARARRQSLRAPGPRRRLQHRADGSGRVGSGGLPRRHPRLPGGARGLLPSTQLGTGGHLPATASEPGRYTWWDYRAGAFHKNFGMRIDHLLATRPIANQTVWAEIDREARKGKPIPSDHAPLVIDVGKPGVAFDAGWKRVAGTA